MAYTTIDDSEKYFQVKAYTGNGTAIGSGGLAVTLDGETDLTPAIVWIKSLSTAEEQMIFDVPRGVTKALKPSTTDAEATGSEFLTAFGSDGFTLGNHDKVNANTVTYVAWCWKMGTTSGISGTGNLTVNSYSFDSDAKQSVIVYTGNGGSSGTYTHGLGVAPGFIFGKNVDEAGDDWFAYHHKNTSAPETDYLEMNKTTVTTDSADYWNDVAPTSTLVTVGGGGEVNRAEQQVAYCFAGVQGYSKFGSYVGNGSTNGPVTWTGFRPALVIVKRTDTSGGWYMWDTKRPGYNVENGYVQADSASAEDTNSGNFGFDFLATGFKLRGSYATVNASGGTYMYMAWAHSPYVNSNGVPNTVHG